MLLAVLFLAFVLLGAGLLLQAIHIFRLEAEIERLQLAARRGGG